MTLPLPAHVKNDRVQDNFNKIARQFPVQWPQLAGAIVPVFNVRDFGAKPDYDDATVTGTDNGPMIQDAIDKAVDAGGGTVFIPAGEYAVDTALTVPADVCIRIMGEGCGISAGSGARMTMLARTNQTMTDPLLTAAGNSPGSAITDRCHLEMRDIFLNGKSKTVPGLEVTYGSECYFRRMRLANFIGKGGNFEQLFNSSFHGCFFGSNGQSGTTTPGVVITDDGAGDGSISNHMTDCEFAGGRGTELKLEGASNNWTFSGLKFESGVGATQNWPYLHIDDCSIVQMANVVITATSARTVAPLLIEQSGAGGGGEEQSVKIANLNVQGQGDNLPYYIDIEGMTVLATNVYLGGSVSTDGVPTTAFVRIASGVRDGGVKFTNLKVPNYTDPSTVPVFEDNRSAIAPRNVVNYPPDVQGLDAVPVTASAATVTLPAHSNVHTISGTTTITSVTASWPGRTVTLIFPNALTFTDGSNLKLAGNFVTTGDDTITLVSGGADWYEVARSVN